ncbi:MAG TPA: OadG family transporter subunit [Gammaproteobacteria bacterium]|nr:OadG family transporter subunit [Gammaproteobacteria bacterium]
MSNIEQLMIQSLQLLGLGMGAVFVILILLIVLISIVAKLVPEEARPSPAAPAARPDADHLAAIAAAIHQHRKQGK